MAPEVLTLYSGGFMTSADPKHTPPHPSQMRGRGLSLEEYTRQMEEKIVGQDTTGDGKIDHITMDTTGDGDMDTVLSAGSFLARFAERAGDGIDGGETKSAAEGSAKGVRRPSSSAKVRTERLVSKRSSCAAPPQHRQAIMTYKSRSTKRTPKTIVPVGRVLANNGAAEGKSDDDLNAVLLSDTPDAVTSSSVQSRPSPGAISRLGPKRMSALMQSAVHEVHDRNVANYIEHDEYPELPPSDDHVAFKHLFFPSYIIQHQTGVVPGLQGQESFEPARNCEKRKRDREREREKESATC